MKNLNVLLLVIVAIIFAGCASSPETAQVTPGIIESEITETIINHQAKAYRGDTLPEWVGVVLDGQNAPLRDLYPNNAVFTNQSRGKDLDALKYWANTFDVNSVVASQLNTYFKSNAAEVANASDDAISRVADTLAGVTAEAQFSGLQKEAEYWILWQSTTGEQEYQYLVLYTMTNAMYNTNLDRIIDAIDAADRDVVTEVFEKIKAEGFFPE
ncbi:MAG: hypothetical protein R3Y36_01645 [Spirochaetales bacterium]